MQKLCIYALNYTTDLPTGIIYNMYFLSFAGKESLDKFRTIICPHPQRKKRLCISLLAFPPLGEGEPFAVDAGIASFVPHQSPPVTASPKGNPVFIYSIICSCFLLRGKLFSFARPLSVTAPKGKPLLLRIAIAFCSKRYCPQRGAKKGAPLGAPFFAIFYISSAFRYPTPRSTARNEKLNRKNFKTYFFVSPGHTRR